MREKQIPLFLAVLIAINCSCSKKDSDSDSKNTDQDIANNWTCKEVSGVCLPCSDGREHCIDPAADLASKDAPVDSWFVVSQVKTADGHEFNFLSHMMRFPAEIYLAVNSLTDKTNHWYSGMEYDYVAPQVSISNKELSVEMPDASLSGSIKKMHLTANLPDGYIDVTMSPQGPTLYNCSTSFFRMLNQDTYEYALPRMETKGVITVKGTQYQVSGISWLDRQWVPKVDSTYINRNYKWTWMNLNMDNGDFISLFDIIDKNKRSETAFATILHSDGSHRVVPITPLANYASDYWTSSVTGQSYPTHLVVDIPCLETRLDVVPTVRNQEVVSVIDKKYEGASTVTGKYLGKAANGYTYVEMVGKWK